MVGVLATVALAALAADAGEQRFELATELMAADDHEAAAEALVSLADDLPDSRFADDALFTAAQLCEERIGDPVRALALYERLAAEYPNSRSSLAASRRAEALRRDLGADGGGAAALAAFNEIKREYPNRPPAESVAAMEQLVADNPDWIGTRRALLWLARAYDRAGDEKAAAGAFRRIAEAYPGSHEAFQSHLGLGDLAVRAGHFDQAEAHYRAIEVGDDPGRARAKEHALARLDTERVRADTYTMSFVAVGLISLLLVGSLRHGARSWGAAGAAVRSVPSEVIYFAPVAVVLLGAAFTGHEQIAPATAIILVGGGCLTWLSGAGLAATRAVRGRVETWRALGHAAGVAVAVLAVVYIALHRTRLVDFIVETVKFGPER